MSNYGIKVSKSGDDVDRVVNDYELRFNSNTPLTGIKDTGTYEYTLPATTPADGTKVNITSHDYGYKPKILGYYQNQDSGKRKYLPKFDFSFGSVGYSLMIKSDISNIFLKWAVDTSGPTSEDTLLITYYILTDKGE